MQHYSHICEYGCTYVMLYVHIYYMDALKKNVTLLEYVTLLIHFIWMCIHIHVYVNEECYMFVQFFTCIAIWGGHIGLFRERDV